MKNYLLFILGISLWGISTMKAQTPDAIYIATWVTMQELGTPVTPNDNDPVLTYNPATGCYEGEVIDWPRVSVNPYNAKIPYSVEGDVVTYYGVDGTTQTFIFNSEDSYTFHFTENTDPSKFKGYALSTANETSVADVKISMNLETKEITFTKFESGQGGVIPTLESVYPVNGSEIVLEEGEESITVTLAFSGEVTSMEALYNGVVLSSQGNQDGTVWNVSVPVERLMASDDDDEDEGEDSGEEETQKQLYIIIQKVYSGNLPVSFEDGKVFLNLSYTVIGLPAGVETIATEEHSLKVYNLNGSPVLTTKNANELKNLQPGVYIVNGKKIMVK